MELDAILPEYDFNEYHAMEATVSPDAARRAAWGLPADGVSPLVSILMKLRSIPAALTGKPFMQGHGGSVGFLQRMTDGPFILLADLPDEIVLGLVGQFWKPDGGLVRGIGGLHDFTAFERPGFAKVAMNLYFSPHPSGTRISTETRIRTFGPDARKNFARYWRLVSIGSGWTRMLWLSAIKKQALASTA